MAKHKDGEVEYGSHPGPFHGSPKETHSFKAGGYSTKKLTIASQPGKAAMRIKPHIEGASFEGGAKSKGKKTTPKEYGDDE